MEAKETKFFAHQGKVVETEEVEALGIQRQYTEMAVKVKGIFAPEKKEHSGNLTVEIVKSFESKNPK